MILGLIWKQRIDLNEIKIFFCFINYKKLKGLFIYYN